MNTSGRIALVQSPSDAKSIPVGCLWEEEFPGIFSTAPLGDQHCDTPGSIQTPFCCNLYHLHLVAGPSRRGSHLNSPPWAEQFLSVPIWSQAPICTTSPHESKSPAKQQQKKKRSIEGGRGGENGFKTWTHQETVSMATSHSYSSSSLF